MSATGGAFESLDLFAFFIEQFSVDSIYELGWYAARDWMAVVTGVLVAIAIGIRMVEEKVAVIGSGKSNYIKMATSVLLVAVAIALYFTLATLVINFFNTIYGMLANADKMGELTSNLDRMVNVIVEKPWDLSWSDVAESFYAVFAFCTYAVTYGLLIFMIFGMRIAHAILVSFCLFWGMVALPMSITTGLKSLTAWRNICILALIWPLVDAFFLYLVGGAFAIAMSDSGNSLSILEAQDTVSMGMLFYYLAIFSIINLFLAATAFSAPFVAQGMANNSGNVTGMIGSFGAAALGAGAIAGKYMTSGFNKAGAMAGKPVGKAGGAIAGKVGSGIAAGMMSVPGMGAMAQLAGGLGGRGFAGEGCFGSSRSKTSGSTPTADKKMAANSGGSQSGSQSKSAANNQSKTTKQSNATQKQGSKKRSSGGGKKASTLSASANGDDNGAASVKPSSTPSEGGNLSEEANRKKRLKAKQQARRGAIINQKKQRKNEDFGMSNNVNNKPSPSGNSDDLMSKAAAYGRFGWIAFFIILLAFIGQNIFYALKPDKFIAINSQGEALGQVIFDEARIRPLDKITADMKSFVQYCTSVNKLSIYGDLATCFNHMEKNMANDRLDAYEKSGYVTRIANAGCERTSIQFDSALTAVTRDEYGYAAEGRLVGDLICIKPGKDPTSQPFDISLSAELIFRNADYPLGLRVVRFEDVEA
ncbi:MAG: hypothetical protein GY814_13940 [Gammaproteobacteria bacterium]|nr:hypothetical protein [Gammaproteobacteria bacterium]